MTKTDTYIRQLRDLTSLYAVHPTLPLPYSPTLSFFISGDLDEALDLRDLMLNPVVTQDGNKDFPVTITGTLCGFPAVVYLTAGVAFEDPATPVVLPALDQRLAVKVKAAS